MKSLKSLFSVLLPCLLLFSACQKENLKTKNENITIEEEPVQSRLNPNEVVWTYSRDTPNQPCGDPDFTVCYVDFTPIEDIVEENQTRGIISVNSDGDVVMSFDQIDLDQTVLTDLYTTHIISFQSDIELPQDLVSALLVAAGFPPLDEPSFMRAGNYAVSFEGEIPDGPAYKNPDEITVVFCPRTEMWKFFRVWPASSEEPEAQ